MRVFIASLGFLCCLSFKNTWASNINKNNLQEVSRFIKAKNSSVDSIKIASALLRASESTKIPWRILASIAFIESSFKVDAVNKLSNDYGLMQINQYNINAYGFDKKRLLNDLNYSAMAGATVFNWFYRRYPLDEAIARYNCGTLKRCVLYTSVQKYVLKFKKNL